jgi:hypothetical protein
MFRPAQTLLVLFLVIFATGCSQPQTYDSSSGRFTIDFPGKPKEQSQTVQTPTGNVTAHIIMYESRIAAYVVTYSDFPASQIKSSSADELLDGACQGVASNIGGTITSQKSISIDNHPGQEVKVSASSRGKKVEVRNRIYLVGNRLYQVIVTAAPGDTEDATANKFVTSFKLK